MCVFLEEFENKVPLFWWKGFGRPYIMVKNPAILHLRPRELCLLHVNKFKGFNFPGNESGPIVCLYIIA